MARQETSCASWMDDLLLVMLGIRSAWRTELDCTPASLFLGHHCQFQGHFSRTGR